MYKYRLNLLGEVKLIRSDGRNLTPKGKKARGLLAVLAVSPHGARGRRWLQGHLWSDRGDNEGAGSLRQCLTEIRRALEADRDAFLTEQQSVRLDLDLVSVDVRNLDSDETLAGLDEHALPQFLEALDVVDPEFVTWVRDQRTYWDGKLRAALAARKARGEPVGGDAIVGAREPAAAARLPAAREKPVISVKPPAMRNSSEDAVVAETFAYELIEQLSRMRWLLTTSQSSCFSESVRDLPAQQFGAALGSDYVVVGKLYREDERYVLRVELVEAASLVVVWNNVFYLWLDKIDEDLPAAAKQIAGNISSRISHSEQTRASAGTQRTDELQHLIWRGRWHLNRLRVKDAEQAEACFRRVLALDPHNVEAHVQIAWCKIWSAWAQRGSQENIIEGRELGRLAMTLDSTDARGFWIVGTAETWLRNKDVARASINEAIRLCPSMALAHAQLGSCFIMEGQPDRAIQPLLVATKLSPEDQHLFYFQGELAMANWLLGRFEDALRAADLSLLRRSSYWYAHLVRLLSYRALRNDGMARLAMAALLKARPRLSRADIEWLPFTDAQINQTIIERSGLFA